jgi:tRNA pseudouridine38-40 synthase
LRRYKITIQYDGSFFNGWQLQKDNKTVQGEIENALKTITKSENRFPIKGAGRTDAGVHALGQVAHFDMDTRLTDLELKNAMNFYISKYCKIISLCQIYSDFDSRRDALKRTYIYQLYLGPSILFDNQAWLIENIDLIVLKQLSKFIKGEHDFLSFSKFDSSKEHTLSIVYASDWKKNGDIVTYKISANRFLHHMIRYIVGTMVEVSRGNFSEDQFKSLLHIPRKNVQIYKAPARGLQLLKVEYV